MMAGEPEERLSGRERQIMDIVYARGEVSAVDVVDAMPDPPSKTAVRTLLRILEEKGHLTHRQDGLKYLYRPSRPRGRAGRSAFRRVLETFFDGSLEKAVAAHLGDPESGLAPDELKRLADIIQQARKRGT
jgi:predicted transcriptional regulator